ncbi:DivIVA domain-containing protein [Actinomyces bowdenii]|uniref:DivIVA domain-containing protein n=1 Tax=Actinomyces bowdenii TaxID=131109 RepID=A0A3P1V9K5_9ACTO|nr:DivIVA domain-containing protein [Actinomyces bowdenii]MBO3723703.1 DivIVA domain-containing protein [Actinomyces bowdenii]RRD30829.1 DivIVA domain-containing protein [Actinomyces bowdenii]
MTVLTSQEALATRLPLVRFRPGYLKEEVDALMERIADTLQAYEERTRGPAPL